MHPHEALSASAYDRLGQHRKDQGFLDEAWSDPAARVLVVSGTRVRPDDGALPWVETDAAPEGVRLLLGNPGGGPRWAVITDAAVAKAEPDRWFPLRGLLPFLAGDALAEAPLILHALGLAEWHWVNRHCPRCGEALASESAGHELRCTGCGRVQFPRTDPAVIMLITAGEGDNERCLLGRQPIWPAGRYSTLAGFCEPGETLEDAVRREVHEETGVIVGEVTYFGNQPWPLPSSLMLGFFGRATDTTITVDDDEIEDAQWFTRAEMLAQAEAGTLVLPGGVSISRSLIEHWYGGTLPGAW